MNLENASLAGDLKSFLSEATEDHLQGICCCLWCFLPRHFPWQHKQSDATRQHLTVWGTFGQTMNELRRRALKTSYLVSVVWRLLCHQEPDDRLPPAQGLGIPGGHHQDQLLGGHLQLVGSVHGPIRSHLEVQAVGFIPNSLVTGTVIKFY